MTSYYFISWALILEDMILRGWSCVHVCMDIQSIITIALEVLIAGIKLMALWISYRHEVAHNILQSKSKTEPPGKEIKDYAWQSECWEDGMREGFPGATQSLRKKIHSWWKEEKTTVKYRNENKLMFINDNSIVYKRVSHSNHQSSQRHSHRQVLWQADGCFSIIQIRLFLFFLSSWQWILAYC